jgi:alginate O-acetyltransferase complex protein AlgI
MLFNSFVFIFMFLPAVLVVFFALGRLKNLRLAVAWLVAASLFFYGWWSPKYLLLIIASIVFNFVLGNCLHDVSAHKQRKAVLICGIICNLLVLGYYKYSLFFVENLNVLLGAHITWGKIILPLAISFHTFQQIAYLVDVYRKDIPKYSVLDYFLFVSFFPQLIAGPITHHTEMLPQFSKKTIFKFNSAHFSSGLTIFIIGLCKKVIIADTVAVYSTQVFNAALYERLSFVEAWGGALCYTLQLYFDFSGYSDMAIGLAAMFGIFLPVNFYSPYKAVNIIDFWRRWHITLSRFLKDYLYIPLGGNRKGKSRQYINIFLTMLIGGLWHGAGWTFIIWGALHGFYLTLNHGWQEFCKRLEIKVQSVIVKALSCLVTFLAVVVAWVFFRADNLKVAIGMVKSMAGLNGFVLWPSYQVPLNKIAGLGDALTHLGWTYGNLAFFTKTEGVLIFVLLLAVWFLPNTAQIMAKSKTFISTYKDDRPIAQSWLSWQPTMVWAVIVVIGAIVCISGFLSKASEFLYFQF